MRIGAFEGKDSKNNRLILEVLALNGSLIKWGIFREIKKQTSITWPTVSRRVDDLKKRGYIEVTGKKKIRIKVVKGERSTPTYWLTWKGLIASLTSEKVRSGFSKVLQNIPGKLWTFMIEEFKKEEINNIAKIVFEEIRKIPLDLESISEPELSHIVVPTFFKIPESYWRRLERRPDFLKWAHEAFLDWEKMERKRIMRFEAAKQRIEKLMEKTGKGKSMKG